jgi:hypothetical protein
MNVSGSRATDDINLDEYERRLRAAGLQQASAEDPLVELARLVESARFVSDRATSAEPSAESAKAHEGTAPLVEVEELRPTIDEAEDFVPAASEADREARQDYAFATHPPHEANTATQAAAERPKAWKLKVSALALMGVAMIGGVMALRGGVPGLPKQAPFIAAAQGPIKVEPPSDDTGKASSDAGASLLRDNGKPASVKVVSSEEQPVDLSAQGSLGNPPPAAANPPAAVDQVKPPASASSATPVAPNANTQLIAPVAAPPPPPMNSEFPGPKPVRTVSLRPDGTPIAASTAPDVTAGDPAPAAAPPPLSKLGSKTMSDTAGVAQPSTPKLDLPAKLNAKSSARVVVAKTDTTAPDAGAQTPTGSAQPGAGAPVKPAAKMPTPAQATAEATEAPAAPAAPPVDATAATASSGWAVQLAAPKSEAEANSALARLNSKYGADLNGAPLGVHKAVVNGQTIYRLRVVGLTKADAAALCARLKGDGGECFIAK